MKKLLFLSLVLISTCIFVSCKYNSNIQKPAPSEKPEMDMEDSNMEEKTIPVDIVFEEWHMNNTTDIIDSVSVKLSGMNQSGKAVEVKSSLRIGLLTFQPELDKMMGKLEEGGQIKDGNTGSGKLKSFTLGSGQLAVELYIEQVGNMATENMVFQIPNDKDVNAVFNK